MTLSLSLSQRGRKREKKTKNDERRRRKTTTSVAMMRVCVLPSRVNKKGWSKVVRRPKNAFFFGVFFQPQKKREDDCLGFLFICGKRVALLINYGDIYLGLSFVPQLVLLTKERRGTVRRKRRFFLRYIYIYIYEHTTTSIACTFLNTCF